MMELHRTYFYKDLLPRPSSNLMGNTVIINKIRKTEMKDVKIFLMRIIDERKSELLDQSEPYMQAKFVKISKI